MGHFLKQLDLFIILTEVNSEINQNSICANYTDKYSIYIFS
jgi:hypothetical protein